VVFFVHSTKNESPGTKLIAIVFNERLLRNAHLDYTEHRYILPILNQEIHLPTFLERENRLTKQIVDSIIRLVCEFDSKMLGYELSIKSDLFKIFTAIIRYAHESVLNSSVIKRTLDSTHPLDGILQYLQSNLDKHISLTELARQYNVSASHFCRLFKGLTGNTLLKYLNQLRIQQAEKLLRESEMPISEIAERLGFSSLSHFERVFRKMHFSNPSAFRAKAKTSGIYIYDMN
jgi:AraC-like DNA-binding protein